MFIEVHSMIPKMFRKNIWKKIKILNFGDVLVFLPLKMYVQNQGLWSSEWYLIWELLSLLHSYIMYWKILSANT